MHTPDFSAPDREQMITALLDNLQAKDLLLAQAHVVMAEQDGVIDRLDSLLCALHSQFALPGVPPLCQPLRAELEWLLRRTH